MKAKQTYLKGKPVFIVSLLVIVVIALTVYLTGINYHRSLTTNFYISTGIISGTLFLFLAYGLFYGVSLLNNFPKFKGFKRGDFISNSGIAPDFPEVDTGDVISSIILSIVLWIVMSVLFLLLLIVLEAVLWFSVFIIISMLYWLFFRAMRVVFSKSAITQNNLGLSIIYAFNYTAMYTGWIFLIVYLTEILK